MVKVEVQMNLHITNLFLVIVMWLRSTIQLNILGKQKKNLSLILI